MWVRNCKARMQPSIFCNILSSAICQNNAGTWKKGRMNRRRLVILSYRRLINLKLFTHIQTVKTKTVASWPELYFETLYKRLLRPLLTGILVFQKDEQKLTAIFRFPSFLHWPFWLLTFNYYYSQSGARGSKGPPAIEQMGRRPSLIWWVTVLPTSSSGWTFKCHRCLTVARD